MSCGMFQVFEPCHPGTSTCAAEPACAFALAYELSNGGTDWSPWQLDLDDGCLNRQMNTVRMVLAEMAYPVGAQPRAQAQALPPTSPTPTPSPSPPPTPEGTDWTRWVVGAPLVIGGLLLVATVASGRRPPLGRSARERPLSARRMEYHSPRR